MAGGVDEVMRLSVQMSWREVKKLETDSLTRGERGQTIDSAGSITSLVKKTYLQSSSFLLHMHAHAGTVHALQGVEWVVPYMALPKTAQAGVTFHNSPYL